MISGLKTKSGLWLQREKTVQERHDADDGEEVIGLWHDLLVLSIQRRHGIERDFVNDEKTDGCLKFLNRPGGAITKAITFGVSAE